MIRSKKNQITEEKDIKGEDLYYHEGRRNSRVINYSYHQHCHYQLTVYVHTILRLLFTTTTTNNNVW